MISLMKRFVFIHIPKTGGNSISEILIQWTECYKTLKYDTQDGKEQFVVQNPAEHLRGIEKHATYEDYEKIVGREILKKEFYTFAVVRNPWDRVISFYFNASKGQSGFDEARLKNVIARRAPYNTFLGSDWSNIDDVVCYERLYEELPAVFEKIGIPWHGLPCRNIGMNRGYRDWRKYYNDETRELVAKTYAKEIELFDYDFDDFDDLKNRGERAWQRKSLRT